MNELMTNDLFLNIAATVIVAGAIGFALGFMTYKRKPKPGCPECGAPLHPIRSQFIKMCGSCDYQEPWDLKEGQKPLVRNNRMK